MLVDFLIGIAVLWILILIYYVIKKRLDNRSLPSATDLVCSSQEDVSTKETIKRVRTAFKEQAQDMKARSMKPHDYNCGDTFNCVKSPCFMVEPDKIVGTSVVPLKTKKQRMEELIKK